MSSNRSPSRSPPSSPMRPGDAIEPQPTNKKSSSSSRRRAVSGETKAFDRDRAKQWLESKQRRQTDGDSLISIVTSGDEFPQDDPDDSTYRGRLPARSRIGTIQSNRDAVTPLRTRGTDRLDNRSLEPAISLSRSRSPRERKEGGSRAHQSVDRESIVITPPPPIRITRSKMKPRGARFKSAAIVDTNSDNDAKPATSSSSSKRKHSSGRRRGTGTRVDSPSPLAKKARMKPKPFPLSISPLSSDVEMPTALDLLNEAIEKRKAKKPLPRRHSRSPVPWFWRTPSPDHQPARRSASLPRSSSSLEDEDKSPLVEDRVSMSPSFVQTYFFDDEAMEEDEEAQSSDREGGRNDIGEDEYDLDDPFIDDSLAMEDLPRSRKKSSTSRHHSDRTKASASSIRSGRSKNREVSSPKHHCSSSHRAHNRPHRSRSTDGEESSDHSSSSRADHGERSTRDIPSRFHSGRSKAREESRRDRPTSDLHSHSHSGHSKAREESPAAKRKSSASRHGQLRPSPTKAVEVLEISSDSNNDGDDSVPRRGPPGGFRMSTGGRAPKKNHSETAVPNKSDDKESNTKLKTNNASKPKPRPIPKTQPSKNASGEKRDKSKGKEMAKAEKDETPISKKDKGKGRAVVRTPSPEPLQDVPISDDELSAYERRQLREAMKESKMMAPSTPSSKSAPGGGSSSASANASGSSSRPTAPTTSAPPAGAAVPGPSTAPASAPTTGPGSGPTAASASGTSAAAPHSGNGPAAMTIQQLVALAATNAGTGSTGTAPHPLPVALPPLDASFVQRCRFLPKIDHTARPDLRDAVLLPFYEGVLCLDTGRIIPWNELEGRGFIVFSAWAEWLPHLNGRMALDAVTFRETGVFRNPARASPVDIVVRTVPGPTEKFNLHCLPTPTSPTPEPLVAVSCGWLEHSQLTAASEIGLRQKYITVIFHTQEWERTVGFICMASGYPELHAQFARNTLQFSTRAQVSRGPKSPEQSSSKGKKRPAPSSMFKSATNGSSSRISQDSFSLPNDAIVPVYDARNLDSLDFNDILPRLSTLPAYTGGEIPQGSFVVVGYTMTVYLANNGNRTLGCNLQWIIVVGTPEDPEE